ncbi:extracellular solute-binding protein [Salipiger marinus]|uniref:extracellular solute-binding protein n=1 Tax=Salipiger marinus TaxID=555512 RepID=UPI00315C483A|nr:extracellular solute-binding protein [Salipiger manganoxidans]
MTVAFLDTISFRNSGVAFVALALSSFVGISASADPAHAISMYGAPALPPDFDSLPYVNPDAPKGGRAVSGEVGSFDSLNPHILKGSPPWQLRFLAYESLMGRSWDEAFTLYCLLCETIETGPNRSWVEFTLRPEARFSDGSPVTVEDVMWSYETLGTQGHPRYHAAWARVAAMEQTGPRSLRFTFTEPDRELVLLMGMRPILKKAQWEGRDFAQSGLDVIPITTAPYVIDQVVPGRTLVLKRDPEYWGRDLPFMRGQANLDELRMEFFADGTAMFEAFKAGLLNVNRENNAEKWATQYDFPAVRGGDVVLSEIPHGRPSGMTGFAMNLRQPAFADWRVREALLQAFNFAYINETMTGGRQKRITSYFSNSTLAMDHGPASGRVRALLEPYAEDLLPGALEGYSLPEGDGTARNRDGLRRALDLFAEAGFTLDQGRMMDPSGRPFRFEILLPQGMGEEASMLDIYARALDRLGIGVTISSVDPAQFNIRTAEFDFDMAWTRIGLSLSPGNEQRLYWGSAAADQPGSRNLMGIASPAVDAMIDQMLAAEEEAEFTAAVQALDRVLTTGRYVIPLYQWDRTWIAHAKELTYDAARTPVYGDWVDWMPNAWWWQD